MKGWPSDPEPIRNEGSFAEDIRNKFTSSSSLDPHNVRGPVSIYSKVLVLDRSGTFLPGRSGWSANLDAERHTLESWPIMGPNISQLNDKILCNVWHAQFFFRLLPNRGRQPQLFSSALRWTAPRRREVGTVRAVSVITKLLAGERFFSMNHWHSLIRTLLCYRRAGDTRVNKWIRRPPPCERPERPEPGPEGRAGPVLRPRRPRASGRA